MSAQEVAGVPRGERPLDSGDGVLLQFARDLRRLREKAGSPTYRELSARAHYSAAALSEAANGRKLPSLAVTLAYVTACGGDASAWEARWRAVAADLAATIPADPLERDTDRPPYIGLAAFQTDDAELFFGRDRLVDDLIVRLRDHRFLGVFGPSGCGKSSVLRAGLAARLLPAGPVAVFTPGPHPIKECAVQLAAVTGESSAALLAELAADPENLHLRIRQAMVDRPAGTDLLLIVDQFEEIFGQCADEGERAWLRTALTTAALAENSRTRVVLCVRADFTCRCEQDPVLRAALSDAWVPVPAMDEDAFRMAITQPAERVGAHLETALVSKLVATTAYQPGVLPMVSHTLHQAWPRRNGATLTLAGFDAATGGIPSTMARIAEELYRALDFRQQLVMRQVLLRLITLGDGTDDTRRRIGRHELDNDDPNTTIVLERLAAARLIILNRDSVELAHDCLIRCWARLSEWLADDRPGLRLHHELTEATNAWEALQRDPGALYRGTRLTRAYAWAGARNAVLTAREREFLNASMSVVSREQERARRRPKKLVALLVVLLVVTTGGVAYAIRAEQVATRQRNAALAQKVLRDAAAMRAANPALALQLTLAAYRIDPGAATRSGMYDMFATPYASRLTGHANTVSDVAISPDGRRVATASGDPVAGVRLWDTSDPNRPKGVPSLLTAASSVRFSPDGRIVATSGNSTSTQLWDVTNPDNPLKMADLSEEVPMSSGPTTPVAFRPDGRVLATISADLAIRLWSLADPQAPHVLATFGWGIPTSVLPLVAFSPDGDTLAATSHTGDVELWDVSDLSKVRSRGTLDDQAEGVFAIAFSPDGRMLATSGQDRQTRLWDITDPAHPQKIGNPLGGHTGAVRAVAFARDSKTLATAGDDRTTRLWDISVPDQPMQLTVLSGHTEPVFAVAFDPGGRMLVTGSADRSARLEDISSVVLTGHRDAVGGLAFSPDNRTLATGSADHTARLWDITDRYRPRWVTTMDRDDQIAEVAFNHDGKVLSTTRRGGITWLWDISDQRKPRVVNGIANSGKTAVTFSPDGRLLAVNRQANGTTELLDITNPAHEQHLAEMYTAYTGVAFSRDSHTLATGSPSGATQLWNISNPREPISVSTLPTEGGPIAFSPDARILAVRSVRDGAMELWDVSDPGQAERLFRFANPPLAKDVLYPAAFSPDGRHLAIAGRDRTVRLWDIGDPRRPAEVATLTGHTVNILAIAYSPDGRTIATADEDHVVRLWETGIDRIAAHICEVATPRISQAEWSQYFPGLDFQPPCP